MTTEPPRDLPLIWADEVAALFALGSNEGSSTRTPYSLWAEKTGRFKLPRTPSRDEWTARFRSLVAARVSEEQGLVFLPGGQTAVRGALGYKPLGLAHPRDEPAKLRPVLSFLLTEEEWDTIWQPAGENPPQGVYVEALAAMAATETSNALVAALIDGEKTRAWKVDGDPSLIALIAKQARWFIDRHVSRDTPPPSNAEKDLEAMASAFAIATKGKEVDLSTDPEVKEALEIWREAEPAAERENNRLRDAKRRILVKMGDAERARIGRTIITTQSYPQTTMSYERKAYRALSKVDADAAASRRPPPIRPAPPPSHDRPPVPPRSVRSPASGPGPAPPPPRGDTQPRVQPSPGSPPR